VESGNIFGREPALVLAAVQAGLALLVGFGLNLDGQQVALIMGFAAAVVSLIVRRRVAPGDSASDQ
jgi:hypothetical protein